MSTLEKNLSLVLILFFAMIFALLALNTHWADTELWAITASQQLFQGHGNFSLFYKPLFNFILKSIYVFPLGSVDTIQVARLIFCVVGLLIICGVYFLGWVVHGNPRKALWSCLLVFTSSFFLSRGFRVRSDLIACFFQIAFLSSFLKYRQTWSNKWCLTGLLSVLGLLMSTPKALIFFIVVLSFILTYAVVTKKLDETYKYLTWSLVVPFISVVTVFFFYREAIFSAHTYFIKSFNDPISKPEYFSQKSFYFVLRFLKENPVIVLMSLFYIFASLRIKELKKWTPERRAFIMVFFLSMGFLVLHNDRLPFFVNTILVVPISILGWFTYDLIVKAKKYKSFLLTMGLMLMVVKGSYFSLRNYHKNSNEYQKASVYYLENYLKEHNVNSYFDGMGALPRKNKTFHFITPTIGDSLDNTLYIIEDEKPEMILFSNRMFYQMKPILDSMKKQGYFHLGHGVYGLQKSKEVNQGPLMYKYQGSFFMKTKVVDGEFDKSSKLKIESRLSPVYLPGGQDFHQIFDFDPRF